MTDKAEVLKRLAELDQQRKAERERKREEEKAELNPNESSETFLANFHTRLTSCKDEVEKIGQGQGPDQVKEKCEMLLKELNEIDNDVSQAVYYLPSYDLRQCRISISETKKKVEEVKQSLAPKKKFAFSKRTKISGKPSHEANAQASEAKESLSTTTFSLQSLEDKENEDLKISGEKLGGRGFLVANCTNCVIDLEGSILALQLCNLKQCRILAGPVTGATMAFDLEDCNVVLASGQVRIHNSKDCEFRLRARSSPIIEDSTTLKFGPISAGQNKAGIDGDRFGMFVREIEGFCTENGSWKAISDFNWIKEEPSPNWSILTDDEI